MRTVLICLLLLALVTTGFSQTDKRSVTAVRTTKAPKIDGILNEPEWQTAPEITDFVQRQPYFGRPASFTTKVRFLFDNTGLYVAAVMHDPHPDSIATQMGLRDDASASADNFIVVLSPFNDGLNAFCFMVTASDIQADFKLSGPDQQDDFSWDAVWSSKAKITDDGWAVEMKIPYSAIRFPKQPLQEWGLNCQREVRRFREVVTWNKVDPKVSGYVNQSGLLEGIRDITPPLRLSLTPYVSGYLQNSPDNPDYTFSYNYGADLKYGLNQSFTLDMTLIPDFGQVRSDDKVYNFTPFEIKYDERRQFFTEGTEMFNKGGIFYTRRVGDQPKGYYVPESVKGENEIITENPGQTKLINASKISGRTTGGLGIGVFNGISANTWATLTDTATGISRRILTQGFTNYNTIVLDQNLKNNSYLDFLNTNYFMPTEGYTANVSGTSFKFANKAYTYALQGDGFVSQKYRSHDSPEFGYHYSLRFGKIAGKFRFAFSELLETPEYDPNDMGFNVINNRFYNTIEAQYNIYEPFWKVLNWFNYAEVSYKTLYDGLKFTSLDFYAESMTNTRKHTSIGSNTNFSPVPSHDYYEPRNEGWMYISPAYGNLRFWISTDYSKPFALDVSLNGYLAPAIKSSGYAINVEPRLRITDRFFVTYSVRFDRILNDVGYVDQATDSTGALTIYFGRRDRRTINNVLEANYMITSTMSVNLRARHYWVTAPYYDFSILQPDGTLKPATYAGDPDVNYNLFNLDFGYIWNFAPGSQLSVMWKNAINTMNNAPVDDFFGDLHDTFLAPAANSFSVRLLVYLDALYFKKKK